MNDAVIRCESVYKIFGVNAKKMLQEANGNVDAKTFQENGCIVGVNNASFEVSKGEMLVVMGLSGSGKSTLLRCISRLTDATDGKIYIEGQDLLSLKNKELIELRRNKMGMVFQSFALLPHKTVLENIAFPLQIKGIKTEDSISKAMDMVKLVGLDGRENYFPRELSGGQQQRVGIARALALNPKVLICDECVSMLDAEIQSEVLSLLLSLQKKLGLAILFITHDLVVARGFCHRLVVLDGGKIVEEGPSGELFHSPKNPLTKKLVDASPTISSLK